MTSISLGVMTASRPHVETGPLYGVAMVSIAIAILVMGATMAQQTNELTQAKAHLQESNETLRALIESSPLAIIAVAPDGVVRSWNPAAEQLFGWKAKDVMGKTLPVIPADHGEYYEMLRRNVLAGKSFTDIDARSITRDGTMIDVSASLAPLRDAEGRITGILVMLADITARSRFLQIAAHELRNPIASIQGVLSLFQRRIAQGEPMDDDMMRMAAVAKKEMDRLTTVLDDVLHTFAVQQGRFQFNPTPVDLVAVVRSAVQPFELDAAHTVTLDAPQSDVIVLGDFMRLEEVVRNLLSNAVKYSPPESEVIVRLHGSEGHAHLAVIDRGIGIPEDQLSKLFGLFFRASNLETRDPGGLGLGLYICRDIVLRHKGKIWAESVEGVGTTVHVVLPLAKESAHADSQVAPA